MEVSKSYYIKKTAFHFTGVKVWRAKSQVQAPSLVHFVKSQALIALSTKRRNVDQGSTWWKCPFDPPRLIYTTTWIFRVPLWFSYLGMLMRRETHTFCLRQLHGCETYVSSLAKLSLQGGGIHLESANLILLFYIVSCRISIARIIW